MKRFKAKAQLEFVAIDIKGKLIRTRYGNEYKPVFMEPFTKPVKETTMKGMSAGEIAKLFVEHWVFGYGQPTHLISYNGSQFMYKFFQDVWHILKTKNEFNTKYKPQNNVQVERFNRTIVASLRSYI